MSEYWWTIPLFPVSLYFLVKLVRLSRAGNFALDRAVLWIPVVGQLVEKTIVARTMRTLGTLISLRRTHPGSHQHREGNG